MSDTMRFAFGGRRAAISLLLSLGLGGCGDGGPGAGASADAVTVRDSAGVTIVENHDSAWTAETRWRLADAPDLVIGSVDGSVPGTDWGDFLEVQGAGERVLVTEPARPGVRVFGADGVYERTLGRRGQGPTEIATQVLVQVLGTDSLMIWDLTGRKIVRFDLDSDMVESYPIGTPSGSENALGAGTPWQWTPVGWLRDGSYLVSSSESPLGLEPGIQTIHQTVHRVSLDGAYLGQVGTFPQYRFASDGERPAQLLFSPPGVLALTGMRIWHGFPADGFELERLSPAGAPELVARMMTDPEPVTDRLVERLHAYQDSTMDAFAANLPAGVLDQARSAQEQARRWEQALDHLPGYVALETSPDGHLFAERRDFEVLPEVQVAPLFGLPPGYTPTWTVFDPDGRWLGTLEGPTGVFVTSISDDHVLGYRTDDLGVRFVERWRILKPE